MVQDIRRIIFSDSELLSAFEGYARTTPKFMPAGKLRSCVPVDNDGFRLKMEMEYGSTTNEVELIYRSTDVLRPLILFCIENNIMLPRDGRKSLALDEGRAVLICELDLDLDLSELTTPLRGEHIRLIKNEERTNIALEKAAPIAKS